MTTTLTILNWGLLVISLPGIPLGMRNPVVGWRYGIATQVAWFAYGVWSIQYGSAVLAVVFVGLYTWSLYTWRHGPPVRVLLSALKTLRAANLLPAQQYADLCDAVREHRHVIIDVLPSAAVASGGDVRPRWRQILNSSASKERLHR